MKIYDSKFEKAVETGLGINKNTTYRLDYVSKHTYTPDFVDYKNKIIYESKLIPKAVRPKKDD